MDDPDLSHTVLDALSAMVAVVDTEGVIIATNRAWRDNAVLGGYRRDPAMLGVSYLEVCERPLPPVPGDGMEFAVGLRAVLEGSVEHFEQSYTCLTPREARSFMCRVRRVDTDGRARAVVSHDDITVVARLRDQLEHQATHDELTNLPRRGLLSLRVGDAVERAAEEGHEVALLFIDLDRFKEVNDRIGHAAGDLLLQQAATRLRGCLRASDTLARVGGDEFVVLLPHAGVDDAVSTAERIIDCCAHAYVLGVERVQLTASIGLTVERPRPDTRPEDLLAHADVAMYQAKSTGRNCWVRYRAGMDAALTDRLELEADLRAALSGGARLPGGQLGVVYQPLVELRTRAVVAAEAFVRWRHPTRGTLLPAEFLPIAESSGLIADIDELVLDTAVGHAIKWRRLWPSRDVRVHVNVSARQFQREDLAGRIARCIERQGLPGRALVLELPESAVLEDLGGAVATGGELARLGVALAVDDFGTGYASLRCLRTLPFEMVKVDRSFVAGLDADADPDADTDADADADAEPDGDSRGIVSAIIGLSHSLGRTVIAEGIETPRQLSYLRGGAADLGQGLLLFPPVPGEELGLIAGQFGCAPQTGSGGARSERAPTG